MREAQEKQVLVDILTVAARLKEGNFLLRHPT